MKIKALGQVFTPKHIVCNILDLCNYKDDVILKKHIIDNSCGNGAFLLEIVTRYIEAFQNKYHSLDGINIDLETYIHGIELDQAIYEECLVNLNKLLEEHHIFGVNWDILNKDALKTFKFNGKMDYVVGNPPYVRVHHLEKQYKKVKEKTFTSKGMTDLFIAFFEIGICMLNNSGILCYITPNSFYNSVAGSKLREYLFNHKNLELLVDLGHYQPFNVTTYTTISKIVNNHSFNECQYYQYDPANLKPRFISSIPYQDLFIDDKIVLSNNNACIKDILNYKVSNNPKIMIKNAFATLCDNVFIQDEFPFQNNIINVIKASTSSLKKCIYPYDINGNLIPFTKLDVDVQKYLLKNKKKLTKRNLENKNNWYAFGRSQAIKDVNKRKLAINTTIKDIESIKLNEVKEKEGVYSGLYILTDLPFELIKEKICSDNFIEYLQVLNKCKSGGYYTYSSKDLSKYLNYYFEGDYNE